ncbi:MAG: hypothetical protein JRJ64_14205 [Deltaproteobacteria bacterium]|nr:hypothetical protein [Deltaproteobacteria bacterium]
MTLADVDGLHRTRTQMVPNQRDDLHRVLAPARPAELGLRHAAVTVPA